MAVDETQGKSRRVQTLEGPYHESHFLPVDPLDTLGWPEMIELEPIHTCNLRCVMCHVSYENLTNERINVDRLLKQLEPVRGRWVKVGATHEPMAHPQIVELLQGLTQLEMPISIITNGTLLTDRMIDRTRNCSFRNFSVSFDGARKRTYEKIRRNANFEKTIERTRNMRAALDRERVFFGGGYTVLKSNMDEVIEAMELFDDMGFDLLYYIIGVIRANDPELMLESVSDCLPLVAGNIQDAARIVIEQKRRITLGSPALNQPHSLREQYAKNYRDGYVISDHPDARRYFEPTAEFSYGHFPGMEISCRAPFKVARITFTGDVLLCQGFRIGNINEKSFEDIWFGPLANRIREGLQRESRTCKTCDFYRFCVNATQLDLKDDESFYSSVLLSQHGRFRNLTFIEYYIDYRILAWWDTWYAIPEGTSLDPRFDDVKSRRDVFIADSEEAVKQLVFQSKTLRFQQYNREPLAWVAYSVALRLTGQLEDAFQVSRRATELARDQSEAIAAYQEMLQVLMAQEKHEEARQLSLALKQQLNITIELDGQPV